MVVFAVMIGAVSLGAPALAAEKRPFDQAAFQQAQEAGKAILLEVTAPWCPTCKAQAPILSKIKSEPRFRDLLSFNIDFDSQKDLLTRFGVRMQSTLIVFKGEQEAGRSTGDTNPDTIEGLLAKAI
jgi:thiol-disulfide isomerase/thioredoxin